MSGAADCRSNVSWLPTLGVLRFAHPLIIVPTTQQRNHKPQQRQSLLLGSDFCGRERHSTPERRRLRISGTVHVASVMVQFQVRK